MTLPDLKMKGKHLTTGEQTRLRDLLESALLRDSDALHGLMGSGVLGRTMPEVFGAHKEGGIVGRPQHGAHEFTVDVHSLLVVKRVREHSEFVQLSRKDKVNVLWAALLHDIGKRPGVPDPRHEWTSAHLSWGVLETLGYPSERIQRIANLISRHVEVSFNPRERQSARLHADPYLAMDLAKFYQHPSALTQLHILNQSDIQSIDSASRFWTTEVAGELRKISDFLQTKRKTLDESTIPILTTKLARKFGVISLSSDYSVLAHTSDDLDVGFAKQLTLLESSTNPTLCSWLTPATKPYHHKDATIMALVTAPAEQITAPDPARTGSGAPVDWAGQAKPGRNINRNGGDSISEIKELLARQGQLIPDAPQSLGELWRQASQFDNLCELKARGESDALVQSYRQLMTAMTSVQMDGRRNGHKHFKVANPRVVGVGLVRNANHIAFEGITPEQWRMALAEQVAPPWLVTDGKVPEGAILVPRAVWQEAISRNLPIVSLD